MAASFHGLRTAIYFVTDLDRAKKWYTDILGIAPYYDSQYYVGFNVGGYELGLHPAKTDSPDAAFGVAVYWGVNDVQATFDLLLAAGATSKEQPNDVGGGIILAAVKDPWGNALGVIHNPHFTLPG